MLLVQLYVAASYGLLLIALSLKWWSYRVGLVPVASYNLTFLGFVVLSALCASPVTRYAALRYVFRWLNGDFYGNVPVPVDSAFHGRSGSDVLYYPVGCVLTLSCG